MPANRPSGKKADPQPRKGYVAVGFVRAPHGIQGELAIDPMTDFPERFLPGSVLLAGDAKYTIRGVRTHQKALLLALDGINTRNQAEALRDKLLEVPENDLPPLEEDAYYRFDIIGLQVVDEAGLALGKVEEVLETGANDVYIVRDADSELLIPAIDSVIKEIDVAANSMIVALLDGLERRPLKRKQRD